MSLNPNTKLYAVEYKSFNGTYIVIESLKELQSSITRYNDILSIKPVQLYISEYEVDIEDIKPAKYKGKPYTYAEKQELAQAHNPKEGEMW